MNKYHQILNKIITKGKHQDNKKGKITDLKNQVLELKPIDLLELFEGHAVAKKKLKDELSLFMAGERSTEKYREIGVSWWDYCGPILVNSYPTYLEKLPKLIDKINQEKRPSKNYVLYLGANDTESNQQPCLSLIQFQKENDKLILSAYQRSSDANLGLPSDIYHLYLISKKIDLKLKSITLFLANVHIYENNLDLTKQLLAGESVKFNLNVG
ncbi:thymidylate synthase [Flavobacterium endoglycinae]|uniref:Thymidylate synthase n=1 Tax=Flavobacterium endoglycinae TaxID=2816357 RepID=A0ABX7QJ83_9FLAO|nr:thymidylate synthase [Flavobacterium endoglycinae]QSW90689.1 thymidylate synthase [Flavobacterium endoglycinae]